MKLYFLRHASAADIAPSDAERALSRQGEEEARVAGTALARLGARPVHILSSPLRRAQQTARIAGAALQFAGGVATCDELLNDIPTPALLKAIKSRPTGSEMLLVGHMPSLAEHVGALIDRDSEVGLSLGKAGMACVELEKLELGAGKLLWLMQQPELARLAG